MTSHKPSKHDLEQPALYQIAKKMKSHPRLGLGWFGESVASESLVENSLLLERWVGPG